VIGNLALSVASARAVGAKAGILTLVVKAGQVIGTLVIVEALASQADAQGVPSITPRASADRSGVPSSISSHIALCVLAAWVWLAKVAGG